MAESILGAAIGKNRLFFGAAPDGLDRRLQYRLHLGHGRHGKEERYCDFAFHGRDPTEHPKDILAERVCDRGCRTVLGVVLGLAVCFLLAQYKFELPKDVFLISTVPVRIHFGNFVLVALASFVVCLLASIYPARQAAKLDPVEIIRYE